MGVVAALRDLRHGPLRSLNPLWISLGRGFRGALRRSGLRVPVSHRIGPYGPFRLDAEFAFSNFANWGGRHNNGFVQCIEACRGCSCFFDIGAHIGLVTLPASRALGPGGRVFAFEPAAANREYLIRHLEYNEVRNVEVVEHLVGDHEEPAVEFFEQAIPTGVNSVVARRDPETFHRVVRSQTTIDAFCEKRGLVPGVIKIDVEGAELGVLEGARETLRRARPEVFLSVHPRELRSQGIEERHLMGVLDSVGYRLLNMDGSSATELKLEEYLAIPEERVR